MIRNKGQFASARGTMGDDGQEGGGPEGLVNDGDGSGEAMYVMVGRIIICSKFLSW